MYSSGHQVGSNTWSNADLDTLDKNGIESQLYQLEDALRSIIGVYPTYLLPPNGKTNQLVRDTAASLGYKSSSPTSSPMTNSTNRISKRPPTTSSLVWTLAVASLWSTTSTRQPWNLCSRR
ncbi:hypothetical protein V2G26_012453 [Clonostachys chloroleuca]